MFLLQTEKMDHSLRQSLIEAFGEVTVQKSLRTIRIVGIIVRENGLPTLFVARYTDSISNDQYFFHKEELVFLAEKATLCRKL